MPPSIIGSRADLLIELVVLATIFAVPILLWAIREARQGHFARHKNIQLALTIIFIVATLALEIDIRLSGGMAHFTAGGTFENTTLLAMVLYGHLAVAALNAVVWIALPWISVQKYRKTTLPGPFSKPHRTWGLVAAVLCILTSLSGVLLYVLGFVL